jgi:hypothetical protein
MKLNDKNVGKLKSIFSNPLIDDPLIDDADGQGGNKEESK